MVGPTLLFVLLTLSLLLQQTDIVQTFIFKQERSDYLCRDFHVESLLTGTSSLYIIKSSLFWLIQPSNRVGEAVPYCCHEKGACHISLFMTVDSGPLCPSVQSRVDRCCTFRCSQSEVWPTHWKFPMHCLPRSRPRCSSLWGRPNYCVLRVQ